MLNFTEIQMLKSPLCEHYNLKQIFSHIWWVIKNFVGFFLFFFLLPKRMWWTHFSVRFEEQKFFTCSTYSFPFSNAAVNCHPQCLSPHWLQPLALLLETTDSAIRMSSVYLRLQHLLLPMLIPLWQPSTAIHIIISLYILNRCDRLVKLLSWCPTTPLYLLLLWLPFSGHEKRWH